MVEYSLLIKTKDIDLMRLIGKAYAYHESITKCKCEPLCLFSR